MISMTFSDFAYFSIFFSLLNTFTKILTIGTTLPPISKILLLNSLKCVINDIVIYRVLRL